MKTAKRSISGSIVVVVVLWCGFAFGEPDLNGQYWFGSLSVDANHLPLAKRGTLTVSEDNWSLEWDDGDGHHTFSAAFTATVQTDGSIDISFPDETYNVAWNGDLMVHAGTVLGESGEGIDVYTRKATYIDVNDFQGDYSMFGHWVGTDGTWDEVQWGTLRFDTNGVAYSDYTSSDGYSDGFSSDWILDDVNGIVEISGLSEPALLGEGGILSVFQNVNPDSLGHNICVKKTAETFSMADIAGTYLVRFLETGPGSVPYTCTEGACIIEAVDDVNGVLSIDAYYSNGEHDVGNLDCFVGPGNEIHFDGDGVADGVVSLDKNLIFIPEYRYEDETRTAHDWLGSIFLVRSAASSVLHDWNGDGIVSIVGDVPGFVDCIYFSNCASSVDTVAVGDCNGDGILSIVGDVPCFVDCVYFANCP